MLKKGTIYRKNSSRISIRYNVRAFEVDSKVQEHELEKGLTMQRQISHYFPLHLL